MLDINLSPIPNQTFSVTADGVRFVITLNALNQGVAASVERAGIRLVSGHRLTSARPLLPYPRMMGDTGNFYLITENDELPDYTKFQTTQFLVYLSASEISELSA